jgi:hypothetical protein
MCLYPGCACDGADAAGAASKHLSAVQLAYLSFKNGWKPKNGIPKMYVCPRGGATLQWITDNISGGMEDIMAAAVAQPDDRVEVRFTATGAKDHRKSIEFTVKRVEPDPNNNNKTITHTLGTGTVCF